MKQNPEDMRDEIEELKGYKLKAKERFEWYENKIKKLENSEESSRLAISEMNKDIKKYTKQLQNSIPKSEIIEAIDEWLKEQNDTGLNNEAIKLKEMLKL